MKPKLVLLLFLIALCSCKTRDRYNYVNYIKLKEPETKIRLYSTIVNKFEILHPGPFAIIGNYLIFIDNKADKIVKIITLETNELLKSFSRLGQGPGEFIGAICIIPDQKDSKAFWIYDITAMRLQKFNLSRILSDDYRPDEILKLSVEKGGYANQLIITPDEQIYGIGLFLRGRISVYNMKGDFVRNLGKIPVVFNEERFAMHHSHGFIGRLAIRSKSKQIFVATKHGSIVEKYNMYGNMISTFIGPDSFFPEYSIVQAGKGFSMTYNEKTRFGYIDIHYNEKLDRIFLLYSGKYQYDKKRNSIPNTSNIIYVMDDMGTITEKLELDKEIYEFVISDDGSIIIGESDTQLLRFEYKQK